MDIPTTLVQEIKSKLVEMPDRVVSVSLSPNKLFLGTVSGQIKVIDKHNPENVMATWKEDNAAIEGIMYDYEGRVIYATQYNIVVLDTRLQTKVKEVRSYDPIRKNEISNSSHG